MRSRPVRSTRRRQGFECPAERRVVLERCRILQQATGDRLSELVRHRGVECERCRVDGGVIRDVTMPGPAAAGRTRAAYGHDDLAARACWLPIAPRRCNRMMGVAAGVATEYT